MVSSVLVLVSDAVQLPVAVRDQLLQKQHQVPQVQPQRRVLEYPSGLLAQVVYERLEIVWTHGQFRLFQRLLDDRVDLLIVLRTTLVYRFQIAFVWIVLIRVVTELVHPIQAEVAIIETELV